MRIIPAAMSQVEIFFMLLSPVELKINSTSIIRNSVVINKIILIFRVK